MEFPSVTTIVNGLLLGWSVAWPPGPINAEMIRRAVLPPKDGGGFWAAWQLGLGACTGDFVWALAVAAGAGALLASPRLHFALGVISFLLLLLLGFIFARGAWRAACGYGRELSPTRAKGKINMSRGYFLGLTLALTGPWNVGFWFAVISGQGAAQGTSNLFNSLVLAAAVVSGALSFTLFFCTALRLGARIFARPAWQIATQAISALVMLFFAARLVWLWH